MNDIPRYQPVTDYNDVWPEPDPNGTIVMYADHVKAIKQAEKRGNTRWGMNVWNDAYEQGEQDMLARCIAAVEALDKRSSEEGWFLHISDVISAIKEA